MTLALIEIWFGKVEIKGKNIVRKVQISGVDKEQVLVKYMNEVIFLIDSQRLIPVDVECTLNETANKVKLSCKIEGADMSMSAPTAIKPIKAATYHQLSVRKIPHGITADIFFDI